MNSRERIRKALSHKQPDKLPVDFGSTAVTGMHVSIVYKLRQHYGLDDPGTPIKVVEPFQMLGEIEDDLKQIIGVDCAALEGRGTFYGFDKQDWKEWELNDGTPVLVPGLFNTERNEDGSLFQYPAGDKKSKPSAKMPKNGFFFDAIIRQEDFDENNLDPRDNIEEYDLITKSELDYLKKQSEYLFNNTPYALVGTVADSAFGDVAFVPGMKLKNPKGIRDITEWYMSLYSRKEHVKKIFEGQMEIALENYKRIYNEIGNKLNVVLVSSTDFGVQNGLFVSLDIYREIFKPFNKKINDWIHENTEWKTFIHTCGAIFDLIPDLIEAGFDILNPVQISAKGMDPEKLKKTYGKEVTFWGGGVNTQSTFMFGTPAEVKDESKRLIDIFSKNGGFVFCSVHNVQANVPLENVVAMIEAVSEFR